MNYTVENELLTLTATEHGAQLYDLRRKAAPEAPLLWDGNPEFWSYRAPTLFPWCSRIPDGWYEVDGVRYQATTQHGFMRIVEHPLVARTDRSLTFCYEFPGNKTSWPWAFSFETCHALEGNVVVTTCTGTNRSDKPMPVQLGFHTAIRWPFTPGKAMEDYFLRFEQPESPTGGDVYPLHRSIFTESRPWLPANLKSKWIQLEEKETGNFLRIDTAPGFPFVLLWSPDGDPDFLCIEPWSGTGSGRPGQEDPQSHDLMDRPGTVLLQPGEAFTRVQRLTVGIQ